MKQSGITLIIMTFILAMLMTSYFLMSQNPQSLKVARNQLTNQSLAIAKQALLAYSAETITGSINGALLNCNNNCPRPGDLPCPDFDNDGDADPPCAISKVGRLPWKTMGLGDLRDGSGERLWYAVSNKYKNNPRLLPLNSETEGSISFRNNTGDLVYNSILGQGLAAVIIAPNAPLKRYDNVLQERNEASQNLAKNYLEVAFGEDNASFNDNSADGFISGEVKIGEQLFLNDIVLPVTKHDINSVVEPRVLAEVMEAMLYNFCPGRSNIKNRICFGATINDYLPDPANITDNTCLGNGFIANTQCVSNPGISIGRIPVGGNPSPTANNGWENQNSNSILQGKNLNNWFQQNGWRELIIYAAAPACTETTKNCTGSGYLTLKNALTPSIAPTPNFKKFVLIMSGAALIGQSRLITSKTVISNYLEDENLLPFDSTFSRFGLNNDRNDRAISIP